MTVYTDDPREVPARRTVLTQEQAAEALLLAHWHVLDREPSPETLAVLLAQTALETGRWRSIWCHNFGNQKASASYRGSICFFRCNEVIKGKLKWFDPPHPQTRFRAYATPELGASDYIAFLAVDTNGDGRNRYAATWAAAEVGDPLRFTQEAKAAGYFTADLARYTKAMVSLFGEFYRWLEHVGGLPMIQLPLEEEPEERSAASEADLDIQIPWLGLSDDDWTNMRAERDRAIRESDDD